MKFFQLHEICDRATYELYGEKAWDLFNPDALTMLDDLREFFDCPVTCNNWWGHPNGYQYRGYRPPDCKVGAINSLHKRGMAFDLDINSHTAEDCRKIIKLNKDNPLLARITRIEAEVPWLHIDNMDIGPHKKRIYEFKG